MKHLQAKDWPVVNVDMTDDVRLASDAANGDPESRRILADRLFDRVRTTMSYLASGSESEDLAQNALIHILRVAGSYRGDSTIEHWSDRVAIRVATKTFEKRKRRHHLAEQNWSPPPPVVSAEQELERLCARRHLADALQCLPSRERLTLVLRYIHEYTVQEIATATKTSLNTVRGRIRTGRKRLKKIIVSDPILTDWLERRGE